MVEKLTKTTLRFALECEKCVKEMKKALCELPQIRDQVLNEKQNIVMIKVVCCEPEKIRCKTCDQPLSESPSRQKSKTKTKPHVTIMERSVDLECEDCVKELMKALCRSPRKIRDRVFNGKQNIAIIKMVRCEPEKIKGKPGRHVVWGSPLEKY